MSSPRGFTLIELLVVITIIVILLTLLTPSLDKAIYEAEMLVCLAGQNAVVVSTQAYAASYKRRYPYRPAIESTEALDNMIPYEIARSTVDDRSVFSSYLGINNAFNDPFTPKADFASAPDTSRVFADFSLWMGWNYYGLPGLKKLGDQLSVPVVIDPDSETYLTNPDRPIMRLNVMLGDHWFQDTGGTKVYEVAHPDKDGVAIEENAVTAIGGRPANEIAVGHHWSLRNQDARAVKYYFDLNFGMIDGSALRINDIETRFDDYSGRVFFAANEQSGGGSLVIVPSGR